MHATLPEKAGCSPTGADTAPAAGLRVMGLKKSFQSPAGKVIEVLRNVSFSVCPGETVAVMGASGAGKSTLLHLLGGLEIPDAGIVQYQFEGSKGLGRSLPKNGRVAFVFQFHYLLDDLTAVENVALPLMIRRLSRNESRRRARRALEEIGLGDRKEQRISYLSGGEQQRVAVARALISEPELVLADEPTGNLDAAIAAEVGALLINYCRQKLAIAVIATHNEQLAEICDQVLCLENGRIENGTAQT